MSTALTCTLAFAIFDSNPRGSPNDSAGHFLLLSAAKWAAPTAGNEEPLDVGLAAVKEVEDVAVAAAAKAIKVSALVAPQTSDVNLSAEKEPKLLLVDGFIILSASIGCRFSSVCYYLFSSARE